ncbi:unnamed protein product [Staurois parvus]|uniref:Syndecan/Neurexin domain-containing protein n=1 Tax=Staurois parvus TaxID=386267 RepID=A0ABN9DZR6_9NEOB|nr:unnamed protein product [Staurois parvus]
MKIVILLAFLLCAASAESIRETETMDPNGMFDLMESSGSLPDDEDLDDFYEDLDSDSEDDEEDDDDGSASGDEMDDLESTSDTPTTTMGNKIPENNFRDSNNNDIDVLHIDNDIIPRKNVLPDEAEPSNEISMASTASSFFSKTEVIVALVAGTLVGLLFAIFIIVLLVMRIRRSKGDLTYDTVKKPIYKKAPTVEA